MSASEQNKVDKLNNPDAIRSILQKSNDILHASIANKDIVVIATQDKADKSKFKIVADSVYEKELEGVFLTFANPQDYIKLFPTEPGNTDPPQNCPPNTEWDPVTGKCVPIAPDTYTVLQIVSTPKSQTSAFHEKNVLDGKEDTKWAINQKGAALTLDLGSVVDVGTVWIWWGDGNKRQFYFNIGTSQTENQDFTNIWPEFKMSSGKVNDYEPYVVSSTTSATPGLKARFIHIVVNGNTANQDWAAISNIKVTKAVAVESAEVDIPSTPPPTDPPVEPPVDPNAEPPKPIEGRMQLDKGGNQDAKKWVAVSMQKQPELWKIVDDKGINIADQFTKKENCEITIKWYQWKQKQTTTTPPPTEPPTTPPITTGKLDAQGVRMIYAPKAGGQVVIATETNQKESSHNTGSRTSLYSNKPYSANCGELTEGFIMNLSDNGEQNAPKLLSGGHTGSGDNDETRQGQCYAVGVNQNGTLHLAKEYPHHPTTPKAYDKIQYLDPNWKSLGDIKNKKVFMKIIYFPVEKAGKQGMHMEWWFDKKALETGKLENDWQQMAFAEDFGDWGAKFGPPHMINNGVKYNGKILGFYIRIDTPTKPVQFTHQGQHELELPPRKL